MPYSSLSLAVAVATCLPWTSFASASPRAIGMEFNKVKAPRTIMRRDGSVPLTLENLKTLYLVELEIGTPPQHFFLNIDTGSSDLFVPSINEDFCLEHQEDCKRTGAYDALKSSTSEITQSLLRAAFGDNSAYNGTFFRDTVRLGGAIMEKVEFGVAETTANLTTGSNGADAVGLVGVGFEANEAGISALNQPPYPNIVSSLRNNGVIGTRAFSLYVNSQDAATGSILFGGVDSSLYTGPLIAVPMIKKSGETIQREFAVSCTSFTSSSSGDIKNDFKDLSNQSLPAYVLLDSGSEASNFPPAMFYAFQQFLGAEAAADGNFYVPCTQANATASFEFGFGGPAGAKIVVPVGAFVKPYDPAKPGTCGTSPCCAISVSPSSDTTGSSFTLGDDFLHSAYLVYNIDAEVIAFAQANLSPSTERNVQEIRPGLHGIPGAVYSGSGNSSDISTAAGTASGAVASATGGFGGNITGTGIQPPIPGFTGAADRTRRFGMETLMLGVAVGLGALMW